MGNLYDVEPEEPTCGWEEAARTGISLRGFGYGYAIPKIPQDGIGHPDLEVIVIGTCGMGNHGHFILRGTTPQGRAWVREGKIARLEGEGFSPEIARAAVRVQYGMEAGVLLMAKRLLKEGIPAGTTRGEISSENFDLAGLSMHRYFAAATIAAKCGAEQLGRGEYRRRKYAVEPLTSSLGEALHAAGMK